MDRTMVVDLCVGESMRIGGATVSLREKAGRRAKLVIVASPAVAIDPPDAQAQRMRDRQLQPKDGVRK